MPPTWWLSTTARASSAPVTPTISSWASLSRVDIAGQHAAAGRSAAGAAGQRPAGEVLDGSVVGDAAGFSAAGEHGQQ